MFRRKQKKEMGIGLADHGRKSPKNVDEQNAPAPERPVSRDNQHDAVRLSERHPSQAEGERNE
jgi:hypothetical protein